MASSVSLPKLPMINFTNIESLKPGSGTWSTVVNDVRLALEEHGCFIAIYDEVSRELDDDVFSVLEKTFDLPTQVKMKNISNRPYHGYIGQNSTIPLYESLGIEDAVSAKAYEEFANLLWPSGNDDFCKIMHSYATKVAKLESMVIKMVFESYEVGKYYDLTKDSSSYLLRIMKYRSPQEGEANIGALPHSDTSFLTILHQNQVNALEVQMNNGEYIGVKFPSSSYLVMAGDAFMAWSNGRIQSAFHRVVMNGKEDRYSLGLFTYIRGIIETPEELVDDEHPQRYKPFDHYGLNDYLSKLYNMGEVKDRPINLYCGIREEINDAFISK